MILSIIVAMGKNRVIGKENALPWRLPADLRHFKSTTMGHPILMGRKTHESIGRALPGRTNIVVTRQRDYVAEGCIVAHSIEEALRKFGTEGEIFVIGGASIYEATLRLASRIYLTQIEQEFEGDAFFPEIDPAAWRVTEERRLPADEKNPYPCVFIVMERR